ncbi:ferrochelatase [Corynebacterium lizhenjunii]|uniref:ferrochelatase n=1 Tax=Corynebacterium lizhenjunii TaxID=2709394 RepID=UPI0013EC1BAE|nr:ferrochelatase [Corynebacterium lizhenjunii]
MTNAHTHAGDFDALLVLSFGGPEGNEEVVPFLENVTRGRGIPRERLKVVGEHYFHFDGVSPLNRLNREIIANVEQELAARGIDLPVYFGNRNWHPFGTEAVDQLAADGKRHVLVFATSAWGGYSACRQYNEDIAGLRDYAAEQGYEEITFTKLRQFFDHPKFIAEVAAGLRESLSAVPQRLREHTRVVFTAHSIPTAHDGVGGAEGDKHLYSRQIAEAARLVASAAGVLDYDVVWNSRSGSPHTPWLEPDVVDHAKALHEQGQTQALVVCPLGFISDHMEVVWDLDVELKRAVEQMGMHFERSRTAGPSTAFSSMLVDLIQELRAGQEPAGLGEVTVSGCTVNGQPCAEGCCDIWSLRKAQGA